MESEQVPGAEPDAINVLIRIVAAAVSDVVNKASKIRRGAHIEVLEESVRQLLYSATNIVSIGVRAVE